MNFKFFFLQKDYVVYMKCNNKKSDMAIKRKICVQTATRRR